MEAEETVRECTICMEKVDAITQFTVPCGHHFHRACIRRWFTNNRTCPVCRTIFDSMIVAATRLPPILPVAPPPAPPPRNTRRPTETQPSAQMRNLFGDIQRHFGIRPQTREGQIIESVVNINARMVDASVRGESVLGALRSAVTEDRTLGNLFVDFVNSISRSLQTTTTTRREDQPHVD